jgi:hypothetical protein
VGRVGADVAVGKDKAISLVAQFTGYLRASILAMHLRLFIGGRTERDTHAGSPETFALYSGAPKPTSLPLPEEEGDM